MLSSSLPNRIVVIRPGALGDTLLTLPALALLRQRWPGARLTFVGRRDALPLIDASGLAENTLPYDDTAWSALFGDEPPADGLAAETLRHCAIAIAWLADPEGVVARNLRILGTGRVVVAPGRPAPENGEHAALYLVRTLAPLGIAVPGQLDALYAAMPRLNISVETAEGVEGRGMVALHPGSGGAAKRWPPERFAAIVARLSAAGYRPLLLQGPQDEAVIQQVLGALAPGAVRPTLAAGLTAVRMAVLLARCRGFLGNDSGVSHLAGLLGLPTLALFGPTDPVVWSPLGPRARALRAASLTMDGLDVEMVWAELMGLLAAGE